MLHIYLSDNSFRYEVEELIKLFIKPSTFQFIEDETLVDYQSFLLTNKIYSHEDNFKFETILYENGKIINTIHTSQVIDYQIELNKKEIKDAIKKSVFMVLHSYFGYKPPWGILTGVRPSKIVNEMLDNQLGIEEIKDRLSTHYFIDEDKIKLLINVCKNERKILENVTPKEISIYIGIPFCPSRCIYCSFTSYQAEEEKINQYLSALIKEISFVGSEIAKSGLQVETIYIGGGTPTVLTDIQMNTLLMHIDAYFDLKHLKEYTVECGRPDTINLDKLKAMKAHGVNRISINPQTMKSETLETIGRKHTPQKIKEAFQLARNSNIPIINMDLIAGLPGELASDFKYSLETILDLEPENITIHTLALKRTSKLKEIREEYCYEDEKHVKEMLRITSELLDKNRYEPYYMYRQKYMSGNYENVGYCKKDSACIYNVRIMEEKQTIIALGAGAISKVYYPFENRLERVPNVSNYEIYIERIDEMIERKRNLIFANIDNKNNNTL